MSSSPTLPSRSSEQQVVTTAFLIPNLHCPTCVTIVASSLAPLRPKPLRVSSSILSHLVTVTHNVSLSLSVITKVLEEAAFEVHSVVQDQNEDDLDLERGRSDEEDNSGSKLRRWSFSGKSTTTETERRGCHIRQCGKCQAETSFMEGGGPVFSLLNGVEKNDAERGTVQEADGPINPNTNPLITGMPLVVVDSLDSSSDLTQVTLAIGGMTCSSCIGTISDTLDQRKYIRSVNVNLLTNSATVIFEGKEHLSDLVKAIEDSGYEAAVEHMEDVKPPTRLPSRSQTSLWRATFAIGGMTCSSCVGTITKAVQEHDCVETVEVNLLSNSATVVFKGEEHIESIKQSIEDVGYDANLDNVVNIGESRESDTQRKVALRIVGMYCSHCPTRISEELEKKFGEQTQIERLPTTSDPILRVAYVPHAPTFTIRQIVDAIAGVDTAFEPFVYHPPSLEQRSQEMRAREQRRILLRLAFSVIVAIPTFVIGIVLMNLVSSTSPSRAYIMEPMWAGRVSRAEWALFIMATPVYFFAADIFHVRAVKELRALWRPKSTTPLLRRFYRFGSMSMLISLGTTIAYFSSIAELAIAATQPANMALMSASSSYFDSVVFLTMFLLIGRFLEAYSKARTGDAVTLLGKLRPTEAILVDSAGNMDLTQSVAPVARNIPIDMLEVGDIVKVFHGDSPPSDGVIIQGESQFDESSLTGESKLVAKQIGDHVYAGTVNRASPISVRVSNVSGTSMLDQIVKAVRDGQARRAPIERVADAITSHFVPLVVLLGVSTWIIWLALGLAGILPTSYLDAEVGGLAAPTALFVGSGLAAQHGILVKGGGEAFREASGLDYIVFDKTGTLTEGGEPSVTEYECLSTDNEKRILGMVRSLEEASSHPVARALFSFGGTKIADTVDVDDITEIPGKGMRGIVRATSQREEVLEVILGNETLMSNYDVEIDSHVSATLDIWKVQGKSVALLAMTVPSQSIPETEVTAINATTWKISAIFAVSDQLRPEAAAVINALKSRGIQVWMISGDNTTTARAVGKMVGIDVENVIAGVLPEQKAEKIEYLQKSSVGQRGSGQRNRATVAMVGDGINDAPALTMADVGIAIGSGSDIAISSAKFVLMSSRLTSLLVLIDLSRIVFRRVRFDFGWALIYNLIALPVAAGVLYPLQSNGVHIRLGPVWASLAMALSSARARYCEVNFAVRLVDTAGIKEEVMEAMVGGAGKVHVADIREVMETKAGTTGIREVMET
ncbi:hypothetical protein V494_01187 [Pseudogymnoascus sp. VKM F-4513 (FW-928)]|nr:hypothetical protein V494_01187 [Pseudogymnoascus sp. VKM F-4513 (FW-928)]